MSVSHLGNFLNLPPYWNALRGAGQPVGGSAASNGVFGDFNDTLDLSGGGAVSGTEPTGGGFAKPSVVSMPSPNRNSRNGAKIDTIVLHHTAGGGTAQDVGRFFQNRSAAVSSHYIIGKDGTIVQPVDDGEAAWHAGTSEFKG